jgi:hypothetical protein
VEDVPHNPGKVEVPPNFLPVGALSLAARLVAQTKGQAFFKSVYLNEIGPREMDEPQFANIGLTNFIYKGQETLQDAGKPIQASVVEVRLGVLGKERTETIYLAPDGHVVLITRPGQTLTPTTDPAQVQRIRMEAYNHGFNLGALKPAQQPSAPENSPEEE